MPLSPGTRIGPYEVVTLLGSGGMGDVYRALDSRLERVVALKVLRPGIATDESHRKRFLREVRATAAFSHPGIAAIVDSGESGNCLYLAMEYIRGRTLQEEISRAPIRGGVCNDYALQIAAALEHAHARGIIHRDIKPGNIMIADGEVVKLLDFGLAQNMLPQEDTASFATEAGTVVGTLQYCAPELFAGRMATVRSDIYSLGVVMYEMACGRLPYAGIQGPAFLAAVLRGDCPPVQQRNPAVPELLASLIAKAMALEPGARFQSVAELAAALRTGKGRPEPAAIFLERAKPVVAVLDFENLSGDPGADWLGIGIAETIAADLRKLGSVRVVSRETVQTELRQLAAGWDASALGRRLQARWVVTGSYQRSGARIRITPKLLEPGATEAAVIEKIDGNWGDIFDLQDRVVSAIMRALELEMDPVARTHIAARETLQLEAYEQYAQGRKALSALGKDSVENARRHFERAIELEHGYALAYSSLGRAYSLRWIHRNDPDDLARAAGCLERALELDSEIGEPYSILCYVYLRQDKLEQSMQAGIEAIRHNPDSHLPHYFLGIASSVAGYEISDGYLQTAVGHFLNAIRVEPLYIPSWMNLGLLAMYTAAYDRAEQLADEVVALQASNRGVNTMPFGEIILAGISLRRSDWERALEWHQQGLERTKKSDSIYREAVIALHACGMADVHLRQNDPDQALTDLRHAWRIVQEFPRMMAYNRVRTRTLADMAAVYAALGERRRAEQYLNEAESLLEGVFRTPGGFIGGVATFELCHALAVAHIQLSQLDAAGCLLDNAVEKGWRDLLWLQSDPALAPVRQIGRIDSLMEQIRCFPPLCFGSATKVA